MKTKTEETAEPKRAISYQRFSSIAQGQVGRDSTRRQSSTIDLALKKHGLILDKEFLDKGKSAYHQRHIAKGGALYELRRLAVAGKLTQKVLVLENWDRAGRLQVTDAAPLLMDMLNNGVDVIVGQDAEYFSRDAVNNNPFLLYRSLDEMNRGFGESRRKSEMAKAKWQARKEAIASGKFVPINSLPWWLMNGKDSYEFKPGMKALIKQIFDLYLSGHGSQTVAIKLNEMNVPLPLAKNGRTRSNANGWHSSYVQKLIKERALLGYFFKTDHKIFPPAIDESSFFKANKKRKDRKCFTGRRATHINPFAGLSFCSKCGASIITHHSGVRRYGKHPYAYFQCSNSRRGLCSASGIPIGVFEESFSVFWEDKQNAKAFMNGNAVENSMVPELEGKIAVASSRLRQVQADYTETPSKALASVMAKLEAEEGALKKQLEAVTIAEKGTELPTDVWDAFLGIFLEDEWNTTENRLRMQECLRDIVSRISLDTIKREYTVSFKGSEKTMVVQDLSERSCIINGAKYVLTAGVGTKEDDASGYFKGKQSKAA